ncbi:kinase [Gilliamella sp. Occ3-1]|uniref:AAA family ATPase n=1 Tax=Gilliamella sp. Occ3-1 TaxID=3120253 RepID=UPI00080DCF16|nr:AAA family ATPase [Gilliamella apicola]OCG71416.1 kinase [Gilliamella apicola]
MQKYLILLAGCPCTGKTYLVNQLQQQFKDSFVITPDKAKILYAESIGFNCKAEKEALEHKVWQFYYGVLQLYMDAGKRVIISEYPFSDKQKKQLSGFAEQYHYQVITIRLIADFDVIWQRRYQRDRSPERHLCHIMQHYHYGDRLENRNLADDLITKEQFYQVCQMRKYDQFVLGKLIEVDVTDFTKVDYSELLNELKQMVKL